MDPEYHYGIWFIGDGRRDWMAKLVKREGKWVLVYRFRYYDGDQSKSPFESGDTKNWYAFSTKDQSDSELNRMLATMNTLKETMETEFEGTMDFIKLECRSDDPKFFFELASRPWAHVKKLPPDAEVSEIEVRR